MNASKHAIMIIKNNKGEYLQYYDERWESYLFLNCKLDENSNELTIINDVIQKLNLETNELECSYLMDKIHEKYSESAKKNKIYHHYFYKIDIKELNQENFAVNEIKYSWFKMKDLEKNERVMKVNSDIISFIKEIEE